MTETSPPLANCTHCEAPIYQCVVHAGGGAFHLWCIPNLYETKTQRPFLDPYEAVLSDLRGQRDAIDRLIVALERIDWANAKKLGAR